MELLSEAYAVRRLSREELGERAAAAYSAKMCGELHALTTDLPVPPARTGSPSDIVAVRRVPRRAKRPPERHRDMDPSARADGWSGRAGKPHSRMGGRGLGAHPAAAAASARQPAMSADMFRLFAFARHAESEANATDVLSSGPSRPGGAFPAALTAVQPSTAAAIRALTWV